MRLRLNTCSETQSKLQLWRILHKCLDFCTKFRTAGDISSLHKETVAVVTRWWGIFTRKICLVETYGSDWTTVLSRSLRELSVMSTKAQNEPQRFRFWRGNAASLSTVGTWFYPPVKRCIELKWRFTLATSGWFWVILTLTVPWFASRLLFSVPCREQTTQMVFTVQQRSVTAEADGANNANSNAELLILVSVAFIACKILRLFNPGNLFSPLSQIWRFIRKCYTSL